MAVFLRAERAVRGEELQRRLPSQTLTDQHSSGGLLPDRGNSGLWSQLGQDRMRQAAPRSATRSAALGGLRLSRARLLARRLSVSRHVLASHFLYPTDLEGRQRCEKIRNQRQKIR